MNNHIIKFKETSREEELEFYSNNFLSEKRIEFNKIEETNDFPLIQQIFYLPFIKKVTLNKHSIYIEKLNILEWVDVQEELCSQLQDFLNNGGTVSKNQIKKTSPVTVYSESTPNPNAMKFVVNKRIVNDIYEFKSLEDSSESPLAKSLFGFEFVNEVFFDFNFVSIIQKPGFKWEENVMDVREFIRSFIQDNNTIVFEENIKKAEKDSSVKLQLINLVGDFKNKQKVKYIPIAKRRDKPDAIAWLVKNYPDLPDSKIVKLIGTTKKTIESIRSRSHANISQIQPKDPVLLGICKQSELDNLIESFADKAK